MKRNPKNYLATTNIVPFRQSAWHPSRSAPRVLEELLSDAQDAAHEAFHYCLDQAESIKLASRLRKDGDMLRALEVSRVVEQRAADVVGAFLESLINLRKLQSAVVQWLGAHPERLPESDGEVLNAVAAVILWDGEEPAAELLGPCRMLADKVSTVSCPFPKLAGMEEINLSAFDGSDMRVRAKAHGITLQFLEHTAHLLHLPWLTRPA